VKKLHKLIFQTFLGPFFLTLIIGNFLLLMIFMMKYLDDLVGKGLEITIILKMMGLASLNELPYSLPLAMLLSSTMTFGKLGETVELTAMKSLGVSLWRAMFPLITYSIIISFVAFFISNNLLPKTNAKLSALVSDIRLQKPELLIPEGVFYQELGEYTIRIGKKHPDKTLSDIVIFNDTQQGRGGFISSDSGRMELSSDGSKLILTLIDGNSYKEENERVKPGKKRSFPLVRNNFETNQLVFDLSGNQFEETDPNKRGKTPKRMTINELDNAFDSTLAAQSSRKAQLHKDLIRKYYFREDSTFSSDTVTPFKIDSTTLLSTFPAKKKLSILKSAIDLSRNAKNYISSADLVTSNQEKIMGQQKVYWHKKFSLSFACILMFFIGAPFGAIVRKGGLGLPVVIGIFLFLFFHVTTTSMEKLAKKGGIDPLIAMWIPYFILGPLGLFLTYKATTDSDLFRITAYKKGFKKLFSKK
jgi:lipopolysaccharide export system permease protein